MSKASQPELKKFMDKRLFIHLQGGRKISGVLRGFDIFLNLVVDDAVEETVPAEKQPIGQVSRIAGHPRKQRHLDGNTRICTIIIIPPKKTPNWDRLDCTNYEYVLTDDTNKSCPYPTRVCPKSHKPVLVSSSSTHLSSQLEEYNDVWLHEHAMTGAVAEHLHQIDIFYPPTHKHFRLLLARLRTYSTPSSEADMKTCVTRVPTLLILHELSRYFLTGDDPELPTLSTYMQLVIDAIACLTFLYNSTGSSTRPRLILFDSHLANLTLPLFRPVLTSQINRVPITQKALAIEPLKKVIGWIGTVERVDEIPSSQADETELFSLPVEYEKEHYTLTLDYTTSEKTSIVHWDSFREPEPGPFSAIRTTRVRFV
ncbi:unnamed protein product [Rhizoctonia solani]|nr:unnamed protein product [Rhizoctonia solani]